MIPYRDLLYLRNILYLTNGGMMDYKQKLAAMWKSEAPTVEELLDIMAGFCDEIGATPGLPDIVYGTAGKIFACVGMAVQQPTADATVWQPMPPQTVACACSSGCKDNITLWSDAHLQITNHDPDRYADMILPDDVRLCRKVTL